VEQGFTWLQIFDLNFFNTGTQALLLWWAKWLHVRTLYFLTSVWVWVCVCVHDVNVKSKIRADTMINQKYTSFLSKSRFAFYNMNCNFFLILQVRVTSIYFFDCSICKTLSNIYEKKI
jgi:hypothetical protein